MRIYWPAARFILTPKPAGWRIWWERWPNRLPRGGHEVAVVTPLYRGIKERFPKLQPCDFPLALSLGPATVRGQVWSVEAHERCTIYFVDQPEFFDRPSLYHHEGNDYPDNAARFIFFPKRLPTSRVVCRRVRRSCMHTIGKPASCPCCWRTNDLRGLAGSPRTCTTIHNLAYGKAFSADALPPQQSAVGLLQARWYGVLWKNRLPESRHHLCRFNYGGESTLYAKLRRSMAVVSTVCCGTAKTRSPASSMEWITRNGTRRGIR